MVLSTTTDSAIIVVVGRDVDGVDLVGGHGDVAFPDVVAVGGGVVDRIVEAYSSARFEMELEAAHRGAGIGRQAAEGLGGSVHNNI